MNRHCFASFIVTALMVAVGGRADAIERRGFVIGFGAGVGHTRVEGESNTAIGTNFHVGGMLGSRTALLLDGYGVTDSEDDVTVSIGVSAIAVQRFVGNRGWLKFGLGSGYAFASGDGRSEWEDAGFGILAGAGYELVQKNKFTSTCRAASRRRARTASASTTSASAWASTGGDLVRRLMCIGLLLQSACIAGGGDVPPCDSFYISSFSRPEDVMDPTASPLVARIRVGESRRISHAPGPVDVHAIVRGVRVEPRYYCCGTCVSPPERCQHLRIVGFEVLP